MISINEIKTTIQQESSAGILKINDSVLSKIGVLDFWDKYFPAIGLTINNIKLKNSSATAVTYEGNASFLNVQIPGIQLNIFAKSNTNSLLIKLPLNNWKFADSFKNLPQSLNYSDGIPYLQESFLNELIINTATFYISSNDYTDKKSNLTAGIGLNLHLEMPLDGPLKEIGLFSNNQTIAANGLITLSGDDEHIDIKASVPFDFSVGNVSLANVNLEFFSSIDKSKSQKSYFSILATFKFSKYQVDISTQLVLGAADVLLIQGKFPDGSQLELPSLSDLADLAGGSALDSLLPKQLQGDTNIYLTEVDLGLRPSDKSAIFIGFTVQSNKNWELIPGKVTFTDIKIVFLVTQPFDSKNRSISVRLSGTIFFGGPGGPQLNVNGTIPDLIFICNLNPQTLIDLQQIFNKFGLNLTDIGITDLSCTAFDITINKKTNNYQFYADLKGSWDISLGSENIQLTEVTFEYDYSGESSLAVKAFWALSSATFSLSGSRSGDNGWDFEGQLINGSVSVSDLANELMTLFGTSLPAAVPDISVNKIDLKFNTKSKSFQFILKTDIKQSHTIGLITYDLDLSINLTSIINSKTQKREFTGFFEADLEIGNSIFTAMFTLENNVKEIEAIWESKGDHYLGINDLAKAIGISDTISVPSGMDLALSKVVFIYNISQKLFTMSADSKHYGDAFMSAGYDDQRKFAMVFGVDFAQINHLSDIPVVGHELTEADFITINKAAILVSTGNFKSYQIPGLPSLSIDSYYTPSTFNAGSNSIKPIISGSMIQLSPGFSFATVLSMNATTDQRMKNLNSILKKDSLLLQLSIGTNSFKLFFALQGFVEIPTGGKSNMKLGNVGLLIDFTTEIIFQLMGTFSFTIDSTDVNATARLIISESEAQVAVNVDSGTGTFPPPPGIKGLHFKSFGIIMGVFFEPPGLDIGIQGKFQIGQLQNKDDEFGFILEIIEEVPNPLYLSFYLETVSLGQIVTLFTDQQSPGMNTLNIIQATDVSFYWCESVLVLPDGSVSQPGFGFSASLTIYKFGLHGDFMMGLTSGISGKAQMSPVNIKDVLKITGDGKEISRTYIKENGKWQLASNKNILQQRPPLPSKKETLVSSGGPIFEISSSGPVFIHINWEISLFDIVKEKVDATVSTSGITFHLLYKVAGIEEFKMDCTLADWTSLSASAGFNFGINHSFGPIKVAGINCGSVHVDEEFNANMSITLNPKKFALSIGGYFEFQSLKITMPELNISVAPSSLASLPGKILEQVEDHASDLFKDLFNLADKYAKYVYDGVIHGVDDIGHVLNKAYNLGSQDAAKLMKDVGYSATQIGNALKNGYGMAAEGVADALKALGYGTNVIVNALKSVFKGIHVDITMPPPHIDKNLHVDTPAGPHADTDTPPHGDTKAHIDTPSGPHADHNIPPHGDTRPHLDTPSGPHVDTRIPPHGDKGHGFFHWDTPGGPHADHSVPPHVDGSKHIDTPTGPHADSNVPPHGDTKKHIDTPAGPHTDTKVPPHGDTTKHIDTPSGPHIDT